MREDRVDLLHSISEPLLIEIHFEMYTPALKEHPFFKSYIGTCPQVMRKVCHTAVSASMFHKGDVIFHAGEIPSPPKMYFVWSGTMQYEKINGSMTLVNQGQSVSEAVLWTKWAHRGLLTALGNCRLCTINAELFQAIVSNFVHVSKDPWVYANQFVANLNLCEEVSDITQMTTSRANIDVSHFECGMNGAP